MRSLGKACSLVLLLACLASPGSTEPHYSYYCPQPYPRRAGYGVPAPNYYQGQLPPYLMGGPAYGYTYPYPWYGYNPYPPGPQPYIAPPYYAYQPAVQSNSYYSPVPRQYPQYYPPGAAQKTSSKSSPASKEPAKQVSKGTPLPGKGPKEPEPAP